MQPSAEQLSQLVDIQLSEAPSYWPPGWGWWILLLGIILLYGLGILLWKRRKKQVWQKDAKTLLNKLQKKSKENLSGEQSSNLVSQLNLVLKRVALTCYPTDQVAALTGTPWLEFLDRTGKTNEFSMGSGKLLGSLTYAPSVEKSNERHQLDWQALFSLCLRWLEHQNPTHLNRKKR